MNKPDPRAMGAEIVRAWDAVDRTVLCGGRLELAEGLLLLTVASKGSGRLREIRLSAGSTPEANQTAADAGVYSASVVVSLREWLDRWEPTLRRTLVETLGRHTGDLPPRLTDTQIDKLRGQAADAITQGKAVAIDGPILSRLICELDDLRGGR